MSPRHGHGVPDDRDPKAATNQEAHAIATALAGLGWRLRRQEILEHPEVQSALRSFQDGIDAQLAAADQNPGRHRSTPEPAAGQQIDDISGPDRKPDPRTATTPAEFVQLLREYKSWSGDPSWRAIARRANQIVVHSTIYAAMNSAGLPKLEVVRAIIIGCGGGEEDLQAFASAWGRCAKQQPLAAPTPAATLSLSRP